MEEASENPKATGPGLSEWREGGTSGKLWRVLLQTIPVRRPAERLVDIDAGRGLAMILVVLGHVVSNEMPKGNEWYDVLRAAIYRFHMPFFMVLTGVTFALSLPQFQSWREVGKFSAKRVKRLMLPYLFIGALIPVGKAIASRFMHVDNPPVGLLSDVVALLVTPDESAARFLWFVYVLSIYLLLVPALFHMFGRRPFLLFIGAVALRIGTWPSEFGIQRAVEYLPFFAGGMILWLYRPWWSHLARWVLWVSAVVFGGLLFLSFKTPIPKWLLGACSVPVLMACIQAAPLSVQRFLMMLGINSMTLYLFNGIAMGLVKGVLLKVIPWDGFNFLLFFPVLTLAGLFIPLLIKSVASRSSPRIAAYL